MARIRCAERRGRHVVTIVGPLAASDLRRLESACGPALEHKVPPLAILVDSPPLDSTAEAYLERLRLRGAEISRIGEDPD